MFPFISISYSIEIYNRKRRKPYQPQMGKWMNGNFYINLINLNKAT